MLIFIYIYVYLCIMSNNNNNKFMKWLENPLHEVVSLIYLFLTFKIGTDMRRKDLDYNKETLRVFIII